MENEDDFGGQEVSQTEGGSGPEPVPWPDSPLMLFGPGNPWTLNACVGWVQAKRGTLFGYGEAYRRAAITLFQAVEATGRGVDFAVFPIAFMWRHHLELILKEIIGLGRQIELQPWSFPAHHNLDNLWSTAKPFIIEASEGSIPEIAIVESAIREFSRMDPGGEAFRYPTAKDKKQSIPNAPEHVNLRVLNDSMEAVANFLDCVQTELSQRWEHVQEGFALQEEAERQR